MSGPIQIKRQDVTAAARELAGLMGTSLTDAIAHAVSNQLAIERSAAGSALAEIRDLPVTGPLLSDSDLYDKRGLPNQATQRTGSLQVPRKDRLP